MTPETLKERLDSDDSPLVIDVRSHLEFRSGHIPDARHCPFWKLPFASGALLKENREIVLTCEHGPRAQLALGLLRSRGVGRLSLLEGHMHGWRARGLPLTTKD